MQTKKTLRTRKILKYNGNIFYIPDIVKDIIKQMPKNKVCGYDLWFETFLKLQQPKRGKTWEWEEWVRMRGWIRRAIAHHFVKNNLPYWFQIKVNEGYVLRSGRSVMPSIMEERLGKGFNVSVTSSLICNGISKSSIDKSDRKVLKNADHKFFGVLTDMYIGHAARMKLSPERLKRLLPGTK